MRDIWRIHDYVSEFNPRAAANLADRLIRAGPVWRRIRIGDGRFLELPCVNL
jgi:hypothetical protein